MKPIRTACVLVGAFVAGACGRDPPALEEPSPPADLAPPDAHSRPAAEDTSDLPPPPPPPHRIARAAAVRGEATVERSGYVEWLTDRAELHTGDVVRVPAEGAADIAFDDGGRLTFAGVATVTLGELSPTGRRVMLVKGAISLAAAREVPIEVQTTGDVSLVLQDCSAVVRVLPGDHVVFRRLAPGHAQVWNESTRKAEDLGEVELEFDLSATPRAK